MPPLNCLCMLLLCKLVTGAPGKYCPGEEGQEEAEGEGGGEKQPSPGHSWLSQHQGAEQGFSFRNTAPSSGPWPWPCLYGDHSGGGDTYLCSLTALKSGTPGFPA